MNFELILPFLHPIELLLLEDDGSAKRFLMEPIHEVDHATA
jgi:hypothetical protein